MALPIRASQCGASLYDCAIYSTEHQDFTAAVRSLEELLKRSPRDLKALNLLGIALTGLGEIEKANLQFKKVLRLNPGFYPALKNLAVNELALNKPSEAKGHFEQYLKHEPADEVAHLSLAEIFFKERQYGPALEHYEKARRRIVTNSELIFHYAECSLRQGRQQQALTMLDLLPTGDAEDHFKAGTILAQAEAYEAAATHFGLARKGYRDPYDAGYNQALAYIKGGDFTAAIRVAGELFSQGYQRAELYNLVSQAYLQAGDVQGAYDALRTATRLDPQDESNYTDLALICLDYSNYDLGLEITNVGLKHLPNSDRLYLQRGVMEAMKGQFTQAEQDFAEAAKRAPEKAVHYVALGTVWMQTGHVEKAIDIMRAGARKKPNDFLTQYMLGRALLQSGALPRALAGEEAFAALQTSVRLNPNFWHSRVELGKLLLKRGEVDRAIQELEKAVELNPGQATPAYPLAQAYRAKGNLARAQELLDRVSKIQAAQREGSFNVVLKRLVRESSP